MGMNQKGQIPACCRSGLESLGSVGGARVPSQEGPQLEKWRAKGAGPPGRGGQPLPQDEALLVSGFNFMLDQHGWPDGVGGGGGGNWGEA